MCFAFKYTQKMIFFVVIFCVARLATCQFQAEPASRKQSVVSKALYPAATLHYVNIGPELAGDYQFGYDTGKGPLGQSFREEMRLADGTVKGSYGVIDESGHKRVVHYSAGKSGFIAEEDTNIPDSTFPSIQRQPKLVTQQNFRPYPQHTSVFKPANYLQSRTSQPLYTAPVPAQPINVDVPLKKLTAAGKIDKARTPFSRLSTSLQPMNIAVPVFKSPIPVEIEQVVRGQTVEVSKEQMDSASASGEAYKSVKRVSKKPSIRSKQQRVQKVRKQTAERKYDPKVEDEYYDSAPAFIDIERLSYNIGTDRSSASV